LGVILVFNELCLVLWSDLHKARVSPTDVAMCINLINQGWVTRVPRAIVARELKFYGPPKGPDFKVSTG